MKKVFLSLIICSFVMLCHGVFAQEKKKSTAINKKEFVSLLGKLNFTYKEILQDKKLNFKINAYWDDPMANASATREGDDLTVIVFGGMARVPGLTGDGLMVVLCHEIGHLIGGAPKIEIIKDYSVEGQADYFAVSKCAKNVWGQDDNFKIMSTKIIDPYLNKVCNKQFLDVQEAALCKRVGMAGLNAATVIAKFQNAPSISFLTPSKEKVTSLQEKHPVPQCRLDTFFAAAVCQKSSRDDFSNTDLEQGACVEGKDAIGFRPRCWYFDETLEQP